MVGRTIYVFSGGIGRHHVELSNLCDQILRDHRIPVLLTENPDIPLIFKPVDGKPYLISKLGVPRGEVFLFQEDETTLPSGIVDDLSKTVVSCNQAATQAKVEQTTPLFEGWLKAITSMVISKHDSAQIYGFPEPTGLEVVLSHLQMDASYWFTFHYFWKHKLSTALRFYANALKFDEDKAMHRVQMIPKLIDGLSNLPNVDELVPIVIREALSGKDIEEAMEGTGIGVEAIQSPLNSNRYFDNEYLKRGSPAHDSDIGHDLLLRGMLAFLAINTELGSDDVIEILKSRTPAELKLWEENFYPQVNHPSKMALSLARWFANPSAK